MFRNLLARVDTVRSQDSGSPFADDQLESGDVSLQDVSRLSTETQRRNGFVQSTADDRGTRITEDIRNGNYTCSICSDEVTSENTPEQGLWHCRDCYNVFHLPCIKRWADTGRGSSLTTRFKCPFCSAIQEGEPSASCWCGKQAFNTRNDSSPNACGYTCWKATECPHGNQAKLCVKLCHPGPCNSPCKANCTKREVPAAQGSASATRQPTPREPSSWNQFLARIRQRKPGTLYNLLSRSVLLAVIYSALSIFTLFHIRWWTQPYRYPDFQEDWFVWEPCLAYFLCTFIVGLTFSGIVDPFFENLGSFLSASLNLDSRTTKSRRKFAMEFFGTIIVLILGAGMFILPFVGLGAGPYIGWYNQMRNSCSGYDTRIVLDAHTDEVRPSQNFNINSLSHSIEDPTFYLASHLQPVSYSYTAFQSYYRLSGTTNTHRAIDVDLDNHVWRVSLLANPDDANKFLASQYEDRYPDVPPFALIDETAKQNGSFSNISPTAKHMDMPELDLRIANMYDFINSCDQEPFLRVYRTANTTEQAKAQMGNDIWSSEDDKDIVMRTASFGHGRQRLDLCVREEHVSQATGGKGVVKSMADDLLVPMAILTAHRLRLWEKGTRGFSC